MAALRADSKGSKGYTSVHEALHLLGLSDRYKDKYVLNPSTGKYERQSEPMTGFNGDMMGVGGKTQTMHQVHWNNWGNYILSQPQVQQQQSQSPTQFILKYKVDVTGTGDNKKLIN